MALSWAVLAVLGGSVLWTLERIWVARNGHPYDLEWMEGGMMVEAWRLEQGLPVLTEPSVEWIPYLYPLGYPAVLAAAAQFTELSMSLGRTISLGGTLLAALALPYISHRAGRTFVPGLVGAVLFLGCYPFSGAFYDIVRLDGLMVALWAWSIAMALDGRRGTVMASGLLLAAAFTVKHNVALTGFPLLIALWQRGGRAEALRFALWSAVPALLMTGYLELVTGRTYLDWLLAVPSSHGWAGQRIFPGVGVDLGEAVPFAALAGVLALAARLGRWHKGLVAAGVLALVSGPVAEGYMRYLSLRGRTPDVSLLGQVWAALDGWRWPFTALGLFAVYAGGLLAVGLLTRRLRSPSWRVTLGVGVAFTTLVMTTLMRGHVGGFVNVNIPTHWVVCLGAAVALGNPLHALRTGHGLRLAAAGAVLAALQVGWSRYELDEERVVALMPAEEDIAVGDAVVERLAELPGPILAPHNPWLLVLAGHDQPGWNLIALWDVDHRSGPWPRSGAMVREAMAEQHWTYILDGSRTMKYDIDEHYDRGEVLVPGGRFRPRSGYSVFPQRLRARRNR